MGKRISLYAGEPIEALLAERRSENVSGEINSAVAQYRETVRRHCPTMTRAEWCTCLDALNGTAMMAIDASWSPTYLVAEVSDACSMDKAHERHGLRDPGALVAKLGRMSYAELLAICDVAARFWARHEEPTDALLADLLGNRMTK